MGTSPDTVLRRLKFGPFVPVQGVKVLGVDDWAWRKGQRYGTILVDLETHAPIDVLPDRCADSVAAWLQSHPGAEVISRDRAGLYADGATRGAPQAIQVADRFHLLCNLTSAIERVLEQKRGALAKAIPSAIPEPPQPQADSSPAAKTRSEQVREDRRQRRVDRYQEVVELYRKGMSQQEISRILHMGRKNDPALPACRAVSGTGETPPEAAERQCLPGISHPSMGRGLPQRDPTLARNSSPGLCRWTKHDGSLCFYLTNEGN
jgi:hypothetical protein